VSGRRPVVVALLGISLSAVCATAQPRVASKDVEAHAALDRSAVWVADRFTYVVQITCRRGFDILTDDLSREKLRVEGPEILSVDTTRDDQGNGVTAYRIVYHLTTYRFDPPVQKIGELNVRYYVRRPGQRLDDVAPSGEVRVPGESVAVRSLLPDEQDTAEFRSARPPAPRRAIFASLQPIGIGLVVVSIVPAVLWAAVLIGRARPKVAHRSARQVRNEERTSLDALQAIDLKTEAGRLEAYDRVSALVREHLHHICGVPAEGLTAQEMGPALSGCRKDVPIDLVTALLAACERARYGSPGELASADECRAAIEQAGQVLAIGT
jgi:hypothetical protein